MKNIKTMITFGLITLLSLANVHAQEKSLNNEIEITPYIPESSSEIPNDVRIVLLNKLGEVLTQNGVAKAGNSVFVLTVNANVISKDITPTTPPMFAYTVKLTYFIGNGVDGNLFSSYSATVKGAGTNETKALLNAIQRINTNDKGLSNIIANAKTKIIDYYNSKCNVILSEVSKLEKLDKYEESLYKLSLIPDSAKCYNEALLKAESIYKNSIDFDCKTKLIQATQVWNANQTSSGAHQAGEILKSINPNSSCISDAKDFGNKIAKKMKEDDERDWNLYYEKEIDLEKTRIEAIKEIAKAYGEGQPKNVTYNIKGWR